MKVALLLTGMCRSYDVCFDSIKKQILDVYDTDVYISSWNITNSAPVNWEPNTPYKNNEKHNSNVNYNELLALYETNLKAFTFENWDFYYDNRFPQVSLLDREDDIFKTNERAKKHGLFWIERLRDQWYIVQKGWNLIKNPEKYDAIIKMRFDIFLKEFKITPHYFVIPKSDLNISDAENYCDYFAFGSPEQMYKYCNMFSHIDELYNKHNIDISHAEFMLKFYMEQFGHPISSIVDDNLIYKRIKIL